MPNKFRHIGICLADGLVYVIVVIGPVVGRYAIDAGDRDWQYVYWTGFALQFLTLIAVVWIYHPPKHPRGVPWNEAIRGLDYVGAILIVPGICLTLVGIINTTVSSVPLFGVSHLAPSLTDIHPVQTSVRRHRACSALRRPWSRRRICLLGDILLGQVSSLPTCHLQVPQRPGVHSALHSSFHCHHVLLWD